MRESIDAQRRCLTAGLIVAVTSMLGAAPGAQAALSIKDNVSLGGFGAVPVGMSVAQAEAASGTPLSPDGENGDCGYVTPVGGPSGVSFLTTNGIIARTDVATRHVSTPEGVHVGTSERRVYRVYGRRVRRSAHRYVLHGHYLTILPRRASEHGRRIVFETNGHRVTSIRAGRLPEAYYIEGVRDRSSASWCEARRVSWRPLP